MNKTICILEDSPEILEIITIVLEEEDYEVHGFGTVSAFMSGIVSLNPSLCLLDVMLPDGNGLDVCKYLKDTYGKGGFPVMIMTANSQLDKMRENCDADDFIAKPFDIDNLSAKIKQLTSTLEQA